MRDEDNQHRVAVYSYVVHGDLPPAALAELERAHALRGRLAEIELEHGQRLRELWRTPPGAAEREACPSSKKAFAAAAEERQRLIEATYWEAVEGGLYWATYAEVMRQHKAAVADARRGGNTLPPAPPRWHGEGWLAVELQRAAGDPPRSPSLLASGMGPWANVMQLAPWTAPEEGPAAAGREDMSRGELVFRIGSHACVEMVRLPVTVHRPIPPEADVAMIRVSRRRAGPEFQVAVHVYVNLPLEERRNGEGTIAAVHFDRRVPEDGPVRVALVAGAGPVPDPLREIVRRRGQAYEVCVPASWRELSRRVAAQRARRGHDLGRWKRQVADLLRPWSAAAEVRQALTALEELADPSRVEEFVADGLASLLTEVAGLDQLVRAWSRQDRRLRDRERREEDRLRARRRDTWCEVAAWIAGEPAGTIVVEDWEDRHDRVPVEPAEPERLFSAIEDEARRRGVPVIRSRSDGTHIDCGTPLAEPAHAGGSLVWCDTCQVTVEREANALRQLVQRRDVGPAQA
ncbi:hypothetical protein [Spirillospora sp. NPDC047279]|uniref:hypothetical protein n=1 Tax=Spirillospora sp. NPDC047279 TaxID=3155478 RepID=UPI003407467A